MVSRTQMQLGCLLFSWTYGSPIGSHVWKRTLELILQRLGFTKFTGSKFRKILQWNLRNETLELKKSQSRSLELQLLSFATAGSALDQRQISWWLDLFSSRADGNAPTKTGSSRLRRLNVASAKLELRSHAASHMEETVNLWFSTTIRGKQAARNTSPAGDTLGWLRKWEHYHSKH